MKSKAYREQGLDLKRLTLVVGKKIWLAALAAILGALGGGIIYNMVTAITNGQPQYRVSADYYITFNFDEFEHGDDYYNAYTWDGILRDDPIVDFALTRLPEEFTKAGVKAAVSGEMLGDYRILTVHVTADTKESAQLIAKAYEESMVNFGQEIELFEKIEMWSMEEAALLEKNTKTMNVAFLGALLSTVITIFVLLYYYILEDAFYIERDVKERFQLKVFGIKTKKKDPVEEELLAANLELLKEEGFKLWDGCSLPKEEDWENLREKQLVLTIPWGKNIGRCVERLLDLLSLHDCRVAGCILTEAEDAFLKAYYGKKGK